MTQIPADADQQQHSVVDPDSFNSDPDTDSDPTFK
jgi:hypothetical protein